MVVLKFCAMILRYHGQYIPIETFSDDLDIQKDIEKSERFIIYEDIEDIQGGLDMTIVNFNEYRDVTSNGFKEIIQLNDRTKAEAKAIAKRES